LVEISVPDGGGVSEMARGRVRETEDVFEWKVGSMAVVLREGSGGMLAVCLILFEIVWALMMDRSLAIAACNASVTLVAVWRCLTITPLVGGKVTALLRWEDKMR
jgi:hypothetical protein